MAPDKNHNRAALMLIPSKFSQPECLSNSLTRERISARLDELASHRVALIHSPAGYGKTTTVNQWLKSSDQDVAWFTLDDSDNEEIRFVSYLLASLNQNDRDNCPNTLAAALSGNYDSLEYLFTHLFTEMLTRTETLTLILDDYHLIDNPAIHTAMRFLIRHMPPWLRLIITSRTLPPIGIATLRVQGKLLEIDASDQAFNTDEALRFLRERLPFSIDSEMVQRLNQQVEGWPCALQLIALLASDEESFARYSHEFVQGHSHLIDYLSEEVWGQTPEEIRQFLLRSCVLERFNEHLAGALTAHPQPQSMLEQIERQGLFIMPQNSSRSWYRYHPLFASFLRHRLHLDHPEQESSLHRAASEAWMQLGFPHEAVQHAVAARDSGRITQLLSAEGWNFYQQGQLRVLQFCLSALSAEQIAEDPLLTLLSAWSAHGQLDYQQAESSLQAAEKALPSRLSSEDWLTTQGEFDTIRAQIAINQGHIDTARTHAQQALQQLSGDQHRARIIALTILGETSFCQGRLTKARTQMEEAEQLARSQGTPQTVIWTLCQQSEISIAQGYLQRAYNIQDKALQYAQERSLDELPLMEFVHRIRAQVLWEWHRTDGAAQACHKGLQILEGRDERWSLQCRVLEAKIAQARGQQECCQQHIDEIQRLLKGEDYHSDWLANAHATLLSFWENCGDLKAIGSWLEDVPELASPTNHFAQCHARNRARALTSLGRGDEAIELLTSTQLEAVRCQLVTDQNRNHLCLAQACWSCDQREQALQHLHQALQLATTTGFIASFLRLGKPLIVMLKALQQTVTLEELAANRADRLIELLQQQRDFGKALRIGLDESLIADILQQPDLPELIKATPLTRKEWQVLSLIHAGLSNEQIARQLEVAPSTIKTHIRSLYQKLNISRRDEAIELASRMLSHIQGE